MKGSWDTLAVGALVVGAAYLLFRRPGTVTAPAPGNPVAEPPITDGRLADGSIDHAAAVQEPVNPAARPTVTQPTTPQVPMIEPKVYTPISSPFVTQASKPVAFGGLLR